jgi:hypothetical protein
MPVSPPVSRPLASPSVVVPASPASGPGSTVPPAPPLSLLPPVPAPPLPVTAPPDPTLPPLPPPVPPSLAGGVPLDELAQETPTMVAAAQNNEVKASLEEMRSIAATLGRLAADCQGSQPIDKGLVAENEVINQLNEEVSTWPI